VTRFVTLSTYFFFFHGFIDVYIYDLYFDGIDDDDKHIGDFDAFSPGHSQYLAFFFDGGGHGELGDKERYPFCSIDFRYIFFYSIHILTLVTEAYD